MQAFWVRKWGDWVGGLVVCGSEENARGVLFALVVSSESRHSGPTTSPPNRRQIKHRPVVFAGRGERNRGLLHDCDMLSDELSEMDRITQLQDALEQVSMEDQGHSNLTRKYLQLFLRMAAVLTYLTSKSSLAQISPQIPLWKSRDKADPPEVFQGSFEDGCFHEVKPDENFPRKSEGTPCGSHLQGNGD